MNNKVIAIDGPAGAGKSTVAKKLAMLLNYTYIDSGAMYRALTLKVLSRGIDVADKEAVIKTASDTDIDFHHNSIFLDGKNVDQAIREENINKNVSFIAAIPEIRRIMVELQRKVSLGKNVVMDGRDVGTVIFPNAFIKFFITASVEERAKRRYGEIVEKNQPADLDDIKNQIQKRDTVDSTRLDSPLKMADDAVCIDTTGKNIEMVLDEVIKYINLNAGGY